MKKIISIAAALLVFAGTACAQTYFNIGYGSANSKIVFKGMDPESAGSNAVLAGFSHNFQMGKALGLEAGLGFLYDNNWEGDKDMGVNSIAMGLKLPVLLNYKFDLSNSFAFKVFLGPSLHYGLSDKSTTYVGGEKGYTINNYDDEDYSRFNASATAAAALEWVEGLRFMVGYSYGLTDINKADNISLKQNMISVSVGYFF